MGSLERELRRLEDDYRNAVSKGFKIGFSAGMVAGVAVSYGIVCIVSLLKTL